MEPPKRGASIQSGWTEEGKKQSQAVLQLNVEGDKGK